MTFLENHMHFFAPLAKNIAVILAVLFAVTAAAQSDESVSQAAVLDTFEGRIDLTALENYADQTIPSYITKRNNYDNPISDAGATLGRVLFYDTLLSIDESISCASCHMQDHGFGSPDAVSPGVMGGVTARHSARLVNTLFSNESRFFWDERASSLVDQVLHPLRDHNEHGFSGQDARPDMAELIRRVAAKPYYQELFGFAFEDSDITEDNMARALAQFVNSIQSFDSRYDLGRAQTGRNNGDFKNFTADENAGKALFMTTVSDGGAGCSVCHLAPEFDIHPTGNHIGIIGVAGAPTEFDLSNTRSPSLRDVLGPEGEANGPFMHDGSLETLRQVIDHYDAIPAPNPNIDLTEAEYIRTMDGSLLQNGQPQKLGLSEAEKSQLEAFMATLSGSAIYTDEKWSDPF